MGKVLALSQDGKLTYCTASSEQREAGICNHITHQYENESYQEFMKRTRAYPVNVDSYMNDIYEAGTGINPSDSNIVNEFSVNSYSIGSYAEKTYTENEHGETIYRENVYVDSPYEDNNYREGINTKHIKKQASRPTLLRLAVIILLFIILISVVSTILRNETSSLDEYLLNRDVPDMLRNKHNPDFKYMTEEEIGKYITDKYLEEINTYLGLAEEDKIKAENTRWLKEYKYYQYQSLGESLGYYNPQNKRIYINVEAILKYDYDEAQLVNTLVHEGTHYKQDLENRMFGYKEEDYWVSQTEHEAFKTAQQFLYDEYGISSTYEKEELQ